MLDRMGSSDEGSNKLRFDCNLKKAVWAVELKMINVEARSEQWEPHVDSF